MSKNKKEDSMILKRILKYITPHYTYLVLILMCLIISTTLNFFQPLLLKKITDIGLVQKNFAVLIEFVILLSLVILAGQIIGILQARVFVEVHNRVSNEIYSQAFNKVLKLETSYFSDKNSSEIISNMQTDVQNVSSITDSSFLTLISLIFKVISGFAGLIVISWKLALIILILIPIKYFGVKFLSNKEQRVVGKKIEKSREFSSWFSDKVSGVKEIKLLDLYNTEKELFNRKQKTILKLNKQQSMLKAWNSFSDVILAWAITGSLYVLGGIIILQGKMTVGGVFAFITYSNYVINPIASILNIKMMIADILPSARRLFNFLDLKEENSRGAMLSSDSYDIEFRNVCFSYDIERPIVNHLNLKITKGERIAIIGQNGSGKTTILNLLLRFYHPQKGQIFLNGINIEELDLEDYRKKFAVVSQTPYLFSDSIKNNIKFAADISDIDFRKACHKSGVSEYIEKLPNKEDSYIGENGSKVSGGEKQKIAIARALIKNSPIIILDEATANFDKKSSSSLNNYLTKEINGKTLVVITHHYTNLSNFDHVYEIKQGCIYETTRERLM